MITKLRFTMRLAKYLFWEEHSYFSHLVECGFLNMLNSHRMLEGDYTNVDIVKRKGFTRNNLKMVELCVNKPTPIQHLLL